MPILRVEFEGAFAVVPDAPLFKKDSSGTWVANSASPLTILFPEMRLAEPTGWGLNQATTRAAHLPMMVVPESLSPSGDKPEAGKIGTDRIYLLNKESVSIKKTTADPNLVQDRTTYVSYQVPPNATAERSLWWLPRMEEVEPDVTYKDSWVAAKKYDPRATGWEFPKELVASFRFEKGDIWVSGLNLDVDEQPQWWEFEPSYGEKGSATTWNSAIGIKLAVDLAVEMNEVVTFELGFKNQGKSSATTVSIKAGAGENVVRFVNQELEGLVLTSSPVDIKPPLWDVLPDPDFEIFYQNVALENVGRHVPYARSVTIGDDRKPCAPALFSGWGTKETP